jgi:tetratricopeptide (TPR) repeat protein
LKQLQTGYAERLSSKISDKLSTFQIQSFSGFSGGRELRAHRDGSGRCLQAVELHQERKYEEACEVLESALIIDEEHLESVVLLGDSLFQLDRLEEAVVYLERAVQVDSSCAVAYHNLGSILHMLDRNEEALKALECAIRLAGRGYVDAMLFKARALQGLGRDAAALSTVEQVILLEPLNAVAWSIKAGIDEFKQISRCIRSM